MGKDLNILIYSRGNIFIKKQIENGQPLIVKDFELSFAIN